MLDNLISFIKNNWLFIIILVLAFFTRFLFLGYPSGAVFDEVYFIKFVNSYFDGRYYFDIHPPLGKLIIAGFVKIVGFQPIEPDLIEIGRAIDKKTIILLRFLPVLFGALFVLLIYQFILKLGLSKKSAFLGSFLVLFDNAFLTQSKFVLIDIFLLFFGFSALYFFLEARQIKSEKGLEKRTILYLALAGLLAGFSFSIKWTGLSFLGIILFFLFLDSWKNFKFKKFILKTGIVIFASLLVYILVFAIHFKLLNKSGPGDVFMSPAFQKTLLENKIEERIVPLSFWQKFIELNEKMYKRNIEIKTAHPFSSRWYQWPFGKRPIFYWKEGTNKETADIYFLANPVVWFLGVFVVLFYSLSLFYKKIRKRTPFLVWFLLFGYFLNLLPFAFIKRPTFLYHYLPSLTFAILLFAVFYDEICQRNQKISYCRDLFLTILISVFLVFLFLHPLTYGFFVPFSINKIHLFFLSLFS